MLGSTQGKNVKTYPTSYNPMKLGSRRAFTLFGTHTVNKLGVDIASWHRRPSMKICKVCNENLVEDEYHLLLTCSTFKVIHKRCDDLDMWSMIMLVSFSNVHQEG